MCTHRPTMKLAAALPATMLASMTIASPPLDMTGWTLVDPDLDWIYQNPVATTGLLKENESSGSVHAAWVVSATAAPATTTITFSLQVLAGTGDDDIIGFVFAYEDSDNFYLLDWKKGTQSFNWGDDVLINDDVAEQGLKIKRIDGGWTLDGLWGGTDGLGVSTIAGPAGGQWLAGTVYQFEVQLAPGHLVVIRDGTTIFDVLDASFAGGAGLFGFYGFSQNNTQMSNVCVTPTSCAPDINGDGIVDGADLGLVLAAWGSGTVAEDLNGDGTVDGADLGLLLAAWGTDGC